MGNVINIQEAFLVLEIISYLVYLEKKIVLEKVITE